MKRTGVSFIEIVIALGLLIICLVPVMTMFSTSGRAVQKSQNLGFAVGLSHYISQVLLTKAFGQIVSTPLSGIPLADGPDDEMFNPLENWRTTNAGQQRITRAEMPDLYGFLRKFNFRYSLIVNNVSFGTSDEIKSVAIIITWREGGQDMLYKTYAFIPSL